MTDGGRKLVLVLVSVFVTLAVAEVALRLLGWGTVTPRMSFGVNTRSALDQGRFLPDDTLFWKLPPTPTAADRAIKAVHPDLPPPPRRAARRLLVVGDSCSRLSLRSPPYSALLEERLAGDGWEVLNASVPGYTTHQGLAWLRSQLLDLAPDLVVVYFGWNDHWRATGMTDREYAASRRPGRLRLLSLLRRAPEPPPLRVPPAAYRQNLAAMVAACRERGARVVLVRAPHRLTPEAVTRLRRNRYVLPGEDPTPLHRAYLDTLAAAARAGGADVLGGDRLFADLAAPIPLLMRDGIHLTDAGHAALAAALAVVVRDGVGTGGDVPPALAAAAAAALPAPE